MATFATQKEIAMFECQVDEQLTEQIAQADEVATFAILELKKAFVERQLQLNAQANGLVMEYNTKQVHAELQQKQVACQQQMAAAEAALNTQYSQQVAKAASPTSYAPAAAVV